jgi:ribosomal protein S18 acetylase RimI-like enzyme
MTGVNVMPCGPDRADEVHELTQIVYADYAALDPPSGAVRETVERVRDDLAAGGGAIAELDGRVVGCLRWQIGEGGDLHVRRLAVTPELQRRGIGRALMTWAEEEAKRRGCGGVFVGARLEVPRNVAFYRALGYEAVRERSHDGYERPTWLELRKPVS